MNQSLIYALISMFFAGANDTLFKKQDNLNLIPPRGLEPTRDILHSIDNKELNENGLTYSARYSAISLQEIIKNHPELDRIITAWPDLPEHIKTTIKALIDSQPEST